MDLSSRFLTLLEDLRELPRYRRIGKAMAAARADMRPAGLTIRDRAERFPDRPFLRFEEEALSFGAYNEGVNRYAHSLRRLRVDRGGTVACMMENSADFLMLQGAVAKIGAIGALINTALAGAALEHVVAASGARVLLADEACGPAAAELGLDECSVYCLGGENFGGTGSLDNLLSESPASEYDVADVSLGDVFLYVYTSGTTGYPKPAIVRHARFTMGGHSLIATLGLEEGDCSYAPTPLYHGYSNFVGFAPALYNASAFASRRKFSARHFLHDVRRVGATHFMYVGELCRYLLNQPASRYDRAHRIRLATGPGLRPDIWRRFAERFGIEQILETYGQTEANVSLMNRRGRVGSIGRAAPLTHDQLKLVRYDPVEQQPLRNGSGFLSECRPGEVGELLSVVSKKTRMSFDGYVNRDDNESKLVRDCFEPGDVFLRTGDLMRRDRSSYYYFVDRVGDTFRWKGENVSTAEVADLLNGAPGVVETAVYGVSVPGAEGRAGMALLVLGPGEEFDGGEYYEFATACLPSYARPLFARIATAMDVTGTLKHRKVRLQQEGFDPACTEDAIWFRDDARGRFVPLDHRLYQRIAARELRL